MRKKKAQEKEKKRAAEAASSSSPADSSSCESSLTSNNHGVDSHASKEAGEEDSFYDTGGAHNMNNVHVIGEDHQDGGDDQGYSMDDIWKDIAMSEDENFNLQPVFDGYSEEGCNFSYPPMFSPSWDYSSDPLWVMDDEERKMLFPLSHDHQSLSFYGDQGRTFLTG